MPIRRRDAIGPNAGRPPREARWYCSAVLVAVRGRRLVVAALVSAVTACSSGSAASPEVRASAVYDSIVRWFAKSSATDPEPLPVFIESRGEGASIQLDVQADLIKS